ncbi:MAG: hemerythrin domain-containing protein [Ignavibacteria bacterium]|nr:hemerythrin domain-containing protein [Ignavibacteria bacterium]
MEKGINPDFVLDEVLKIENSGEAAKQFDKWDVDFLIDYIVNSHHSYVINELPIILHILQNVLEPYGETHPEIAKISSIFSEMNDELISHIQKEEKMLFPYIKKMQMMHKNLLEIQIPPFGNISSPIKVMETEHEEVNILMSKINKLTNGYMPPKVENGSINELYSELKEFETDLQIHLHLENNILFPKSIQIEKELCKK